MILRTVSALEQLRGWSRTWVELCNFYVPLCCRDFSFLDDFAAMNSSLIDPAVVTT